MFLFIRHIDKIANTGKWMDGSQPQCKFGVNMAVFGFMGNDEVILREFIGKEPPMAIVKSDVNVTVLEDGGFVVDGVRIDDADLESVLKEKIGGGMREYRHTAVILETPSAWDSKRISGILDRIVPMKPSGIAITRRGKPAGGRELHGERNGVIISVNDGESIAPESETVTLNGKNLARGEDYTIDYTTGEVSILNPAARDPKADLTIRYTPTKPRGFRRQ